MLPRRGLTDTDQQGFEMFISTGLRDTFDKVYIIAVNQEIIKKKRNSRNRKIILS